MSCSLIGRINIVKMAILPKAIYKFNAIPVKLPKVFFTELEQIIFQFVWKHKDTEYPKPSWERRMELEESTFLTSDYTTKLQLSRQYGTAERQKYRSVEQNRKPRDKSTHLWKSYLWYNGEKNNLFNKWCWENWSTMCKRMKLEHF